MSAREAVLASIRAAQGGPADQSIPRLYSASVDLSPAEVVEQFADRLHDYNATVHHATVAAIPATIAAILATRQKTGLLIPSGLPPEWLPVGYTFRRDEGLSYADLDASQGVLTACDVAIALTGTIVIAHSPAQGRRALTLVPDYHLCVVRLSQLVATVPEGMRRMAALLPAPLTTISGPSATSDIEMIRVKGVHGPRTLEVILVE
ncbi:MAG: LUD domain-containing protein [Acidobacteria bacterium]|nr:LUD domain-containing protein [Acidobacteriota bacterium]